MIRLSVFALMLVLGVHSHKDYYLCTNDDHPVVFDLGDTGVIYFKSSTLEKGPEQSSGWQKPDPSTSHTGRDQQPCWMNVLGCDSCKFELDIKLSGFTGCDWKGSEPQQQICDNECLYLSLYEPSYIDSTTRYYTMDNNATFNASQTKHNNSQSSDSTSSNMNGLDIAQLDNARSFSGDITQLDNASYSYGDSTKGRTGSDVGYRYISLSSSIVIRLCLGNISSTDVDVEIRYSVTEKLEVHSGSANEVISSGSLTSPHFPHGYALRGENYTWVLQNTDVGGTILLSFDDWDLTPLTQVIFRDTMDTRVVYGSDFRPVIHNKDSTLVVEFHSDVQIQRLAQEIGMKATYQFLSGSQHMHLPDTECGEYIRGVSSGHIYFAPRRKTLYDCIWVIMKNTDQISTVYLHINNITLAGSCNVTIMHGISSISPIFFTTNSSLHNITQTATLESSSGFYIRLQGYLSLPDMLSFTFYSQDSSSNNNLTYQDIPCATRQFLCANTSMCVPITVLCDGWIDCPHGDDESQCDGLPTPVSKSVTPSWSGKLCAPYEYRCDNHQKCIPQRMRCDSWLDCEDGSDEATCDEKKPTNPPVHHISPTILTCPAGYVMCHSHDQCVLDFHICDNYYNCWDRSDEAHCVDKPRESVASTQPWNIILPVCFGCIVVFIGCFVVVCMCTRYKHRCRQSLWQRNRPTRPNRLHIVQHCVTSSHTSFSTTGDVSLLPTSCSSTTSNTYSMGVIQDTPPSYEEAMQSPNQMPTVTATQFSALVPCNFTPNPQESRPDYLHQEAPPPYSSYDDGPSLNNAQAVAHSHSAT